MQIQKWRDWADFLLKVAAIVTIVVGGGWACYRFAVLGIPEASFELKIITEVLPYSEGSRLLVVHARPKNTGKVSVEISKTRFPITVVSLPSSVKTGVIDIDDELARSSPKYKIDILSRFPGGYVIDPGFEYDELFVVVVPPGLYAVTGSIGFDVGSELERTEVVAVH